MTDTPVYKNECVQMLRWKCPFQKLEVKKFGFCGGVGVKTVIHLSSAHYILQRAKS